MLLPGAMIDDHDWFFYGKDATLPRRSGGQSCKDCV
jgi:hypothetical protein